MIQLRDSVASTMQSQLDEIARGLIAAFAETDQTGGVAPDAPGLFTWTGAPGTPPAGTLVDGLAATIRLNAAMDPSAGGNPRPLDEAGYPAPYRRALGGPPDGRQASRGRARALLMTLGCANALWWMSLL